MKGILIDVENKTVTEVEYDNLQGLEEVYQLLKCNLVAHVTLDAINGVFVDDEGLLRLSPDSKFFLIDEYPQPLAGNGLIIGTDEDGDLADTTLTSQEVAKKVRFMNIFEVHQLTSKKPA